MKLIRLKIKWIIQLSFKQTRVIFSTTMQSPHTLSRLKIKSVKLYIGNVNVIIMYR